MQSVFDAVRRFSQHQPIAPTSDNWLCEVFDHVRC